MPELHLSEDGPRAVSPFDSIKQTDEDGNEFWSARDLMPLMGYTGSNAWLKFKNPVEKAMASAEAQNIDVTSNFSRVGEKTSGRDRENFRLTRFAAYLVAMNGDPRKAEVAAAQSYFAVNLSETF